MNLTPDVPPHPWVGWGRVLVFFPCLFRRAPCRRLFREPILVLALRALWRAAQRLQITRAPQLESSAEQ